MATPPLFPLWSYWQGRQQVERTAAADTSLQLNKTLSSGPTSCREIRPRKGTRKGLRKGNRKKGTRTLRKNSSTAHAQTAAAVLHLRHKKFGKGHCKKPYWKRKRIGGWSDLTYRWLFRGIFPSLTEKTVLVTKMDPESALLASINAQLQETIEKMRLAFNSSRTSVICMKTVNKLFQKLSPIQLIPILGKPS